MVQAEFLVITALDEETEALKKRLDDVTWIKGTRYSYGTVTCEGGEEKYGVVYGQCTVPGTSPACQLATEGMDTYMPRYVLLIGIVAGFPERGVSLGDVLVPWWIIPYEKAKITPKGVEYRGHRVRVTALRLLHIAKQIAEHKPGLRHLDIQESRPDNSQRTFPIIWSQGALGSGDKIVGHELSDIRRYLIDNHKDAVGLETEAAGVSVACYEKQIPFIVVKGVQDDATERKDAEGEKDLWRLYAADAAAALAVRIMRCVPIDEMRPPTVGPPADSAEAYETRLWQVLEEYESNQPAPSFVFTVSLADTYRDLRAGRFTSQNKQPNSLLPSEARRATVLHGGGGTGKTRIFHTLARQLLEQGRLPVLIDLKLWLAKEPTGEPQENEVADILKQCGTPRFQPGLLEELTHGYRDWVVMLDGLNEVPKHAREALIRSFRSILNESERSYLLIADRYGASDYLESFVHACVDALDENFVRQIFNKRFAPELTFEQLEPSVKDILKIPFFLDLKLRKMTELGMADTKSTMMEEFFLKQLRIGEADIDKIAEATLAICEEYQSQTFDASRFSTEVGEELYKLLCEASVLSRDGTSFEHHLWRDYLCARYLAKNQNECKEKAFDAATFTSESLEPLTLVVEQLQDAEMADEFLRRVYDWNFYATIDCIREAGESSRVLPSNSIRAAILAAIAEKRFDRVSRTSMRAEARLQEHRYPLALPFVQADTLDKLIEHVRSLEFEEPWFGRWKHLFARSEEQGIMEEEINLLTEADSIVGWTAANVARRSRLNKADQRQVRTIYSTSTGNPEAGSVRWRAVHVLGAYPSSENVSVLISALEKDDYHWVQYGAARALVEIAASCSQKLRGDVLKQLVDAVEQIWYQDVRRGRLISKEIGRTVFIKGARPMWKESVKPFLHRLRDLETDVSERGDWTQLIAEFDWAQLA